MLGLRDDVWRLTAGALRPAFGVLICAYSLSLSDQTFLTLPLMATEVASLVAGALPNFGISLVASVAVTLIGVVAAAISSPIAYALANADSHVRNILLPFILFFYTFFSMLVPFVGGTVMVLVGFVIMAAGAVSTPERWDTWFGAKIVLTVVIGAAVGCVMHLLPLPTPAWRMQTGVSQCEALLLRSRMLMAALLHRTIDGIASGTDAEEPTLSQLSTTLHAALDGFAACLPCAKVELLLLRKKPQIARLMLWLKLLRHQSVLLEQIVNIAKSRPYLGSYPKFQSHVCGPMVMYADAVTKLLASADVDVVAGDGGVVSLPEMPKETAALEAAFEAARVSIAEGELSPTSDPLQLVWLDPIIEESAVTGTATATTETTAATAKAPAQGQSHAPEPGPGPAPDTDEEQLASIAARSRTWSLIAALLALQSVPTDRLTTLPPPLPIKTSIRCSKMELIRAFKFALTMGIACLWISIPELQERAGGHGMWVGLSVAAVALSDVGLTYTKTMDRLWGTLLAVAFGLFLTNSTALESDDAAAVLVSVWIFFCYYLRGTLDKSYANRATQAANTAIVLVFYPGILTPQYEQGVGDFALQRITMVVYGCLLSILIALAVFPESPSAVVEASSRKFMPLLHNAVSAAADALRICTSSAATSGRSGGDKGVAAQADSPEAQAMAQVHQTCAALDASTATALKHLPLAEAEPYWGFSIPYAAPQYASLLTLQRRATPSLLRMLNRLSGTYGVLRETHRSSADASAASALPALLALLARQVELCTEQSCKLFGGDAAAAAAASPSLSPHAALAAFRGFGSLRLEAARIWSECAERLTDAAAAGSTQLETDRRLLFATSLFMTEVVEFSHVLEQIGAAFEAVAAASPQLLVTAVSEVKQTPAPAQKTERSAV